MKAQKKYPGIYLEDNGTYTVKTSFRTKDKYVKQVTKRGFETAKKANDWKLETRIDYKNKMAYEVDGSCKTPVEQLAKEYLKYKSLKFKQKTIENISYNINKHFVEYFKDTKLDKLTTHDIMDYYEYLSTLKVKNQTKNVIIVNVIDALNFFDMMEMIPPEIVRRFKRIVHKFDIIDQPQNDFLEVNEIKALLDTFNGNRIIDKMDKLMIYTFIYSGLRKSELLALTFEDIDIVKNTIRVNKQVVRDETRANNQKIGVSNYTKTNQNKEVVVPPFLIEMFIEYMQLRNATGKDIIFISKKGKYLTKNYANDLLNEHLDMAGLRHIKVHDLRHTFCTMLYDLGVEEQFVAQQMGHSSPNTSHAVYEHLTKDRLNKNVDIINNLKV